MKIIIPKPLSKNNLVEVIATSCSGKTLNKKILQVAENRFKTTGLKFKYSQNVFTQNQFDSTDTKTRLADLHNAFADTNISGILAIRGGYNSNDLLDYIDWDLIKQNPKVFCGFSDNTILQNAMYKKIGLISFSGPNFSSFGKNKSPKYTLDNFIKAVGSKSSFTVAWRKPLITINKGSISGTVLGGNLCTFNLLQGTSFMPSLKGAVLFLEDDYVSNIDFWEFHRNLQSLVNLPDFKFIKGIVFGEFDKRSKLPISVITKIVHNNPKLKSIPVVAGATFGHTYPMITFPIGGKLTQLTKNTATFSIK